MLDMLLANRTYRSASLTLPFKAIPDCRGNQRVNASLYIAIDA